jgi:glucosamine-6-phosphate deaminase
MTIIISKTTKALGKKSGKTAATLIRKAIATKGYAHIIVATGTSQFGTLETLVADTQIDWGKVTMFHLDEYVGISEAHPASFRKYLKERFIAKIPPLKAYHLINGETNPAAECARLNAIIAEHPIDVVLCGIGENGHLAFNDPPADFDTELPYLVVALDEACRKQQFGEGWFPSFEAVPTHAISMSIQQIMKSKHIICAVPDTRKAQAVKDCLNGTVRNIHPASILQNHPNCTIYLDKASASLR